MKPSVKLVCQGGKEVNKEQYHQRQVGNLIYLAHTHQDIAFSIKAVSQFMDSSKEKHLDTINGILKYLKNTPGRGFFFKKRDNRMVEVYTDGDLVGFSVNRRSTSGQCTYVLGNLVTWRTKNKL